MHRQPLRQEPAPLASCGVAFACKERQVEASCANRVVRLLYEALHKQRSAASAAETEFDRERGLPNKTMAIDQYINGFFRRSRPQVYNGLANGSFESFIRADAPAAFSFHRRFTSAPEQRPRSRRFEVVAMPPPGGCARGGGQWAGTHDPPRSVPARRVEEDNGTQ